MLKIEEIYAKIVKHYGTNASTTNFKVVKGYLAVIKNGTNAQ